MTRPVRRARPKAMAQIALIAIGSLAIPIDAARRERPRDPQGPGRDRSAGMSTTPITPVEGPSTLHHLGLTIEQSSLGWAGQWSPVPSIPEADVNARSEPTGGPFVLTGADLYRISCRACHKPDGTGVGSEIHSLVGPVQAASFEWTTADMKARGRSVGAASSRQHAEAAEADLRARLRQGGHDMPAFGQISDQEYAVLRPYLDALAGLETPQPGRRTITEPADRVGELLIKGTCHICHDATQPTDRPTTVLSGVIPSLGSLPRTKSFADFVNKVRRGARVPLGSGGVSSRGRMPVFEYLTEAEVASAYSYLTRYPPR